MRVIESHEQAFPPPEVWDAFVAQDVRGHLLQTWAWGELKAAYGWTPVRLAVERDGSLVAGAQVLYRRLGPFSLGYIPKGPVLVDESPDGVNLLWQSLHRCSRRMRAINLKVEPEWYDDQVDRPSWLVEHSLRPAKEFVQPRSTIIVDLAAEPDALLARMKPKWRYNIRLSERKGVEIHEAGADDVRRFHELMRVTGKRDAFGIHSLDYYQRVLALFAPLGRAQLLMAHHNNTLLAGLMVFAFNKQAWYMYGASSNERRELMPNHQLQWRAMQWAKGKGCQQYDLWGIPDVDEDPDTAALAGVGRFKAGFGGRVVRYVGAYDYVYSEPLYWLLCKAWEMRRRRARAQVTQSS